MGGKRVRFRIGRFEVQIPGRTVVARGFFQRISSFTSSLDERSRFQTKMKD
jgi:hypothetical protein